MTQCIIIFCTLQSPFLIFTCWPHTFCDYDQLTLSIEKKQKHLKRKKGEEEKKYQNNIMVAYLNRFTYYLISFGMKMIT